MSETTQTRVAAEVRASLARKQIKIRHAAAELGWRERYLHRRLRSEVSFSIDDLEQLAQLLKIEVADFIPAVVRSEIVRPLNVSREADVNQRYRHRASQAPRSHYGRAA